MNGELVSIITRDRVRLDGFYSKAGPTESRLPVDAAVIIHGLSGNFYKSRLLKHFASELQNSGVHTVLVNTRGHDYLNATQRMGRSTTLGAAVEVIDESKFDLHAWVDFLANRDHPRVMLLGHSLGAIKSLYAQASMPHPAVSHVAAFSATKLSYDSLMSSSDGERFSHWLEQAHQKVAEGCGSELLYVDFPFPTWMSADAYLKKYGDGDKYNWLSSMESIKVPTLTVFGQIEMEENPAFVAMQDDLRTLDQENFDLRYIPHADHFYSACFEKATNCLLDWLSTNHES